MNAGAATPLLAARPTICRQFACPRWIWSLKYGKPAGPNPWGATGLEWTTQSPPLTENFPVTPVVTEGAYEYSKREMKVV